MLLKAIVAIASNLIAPPPNGQSQQSQQPQQPGGNNSRMNGTGAAAGLNGINGVGKGELASPSDSDIDEARSREIAAKAVTGILVLLLKWLKLSRKFLIHITCFFFHLHNRENILLTCSFCWRVDVLKFEYLTQLLLDSNYIPLVLKLFALHDVQQVVESKTDRIDHR